MLEIELVRVGNRLIGRTVSDRWNLATLGCDFIAYDRNQTGVKRLRRLATRLGLALSVVRDGNAIWVPSPAESAAFSWAVPAYLSQAA